MKEQRSIAQTKLTRAASLAKAGAQIGVNYAKHNTRKAFKGEADKTELDRRNAEVTYDTFSKLKGGPLKVAQMLSIDKNLLPAPYADKFQESYYSAPPLSYPLVVQTFQRELSQGPTALFDTFSQKAVAGASIGQVHRATKDGREYAVKVQYPGVAKSLKSDLEMVKPLAGRLFNLDLVALEPYFEEVEARLMEETDYELEMRRSQDLTERTRGQVDIDFPRYYPELSSKRILTMDWVDGEPLDRWIDSNPSQEDRDRIGQNLWDFINFQVHELRQFHADPHPGNFLVKDNQLWALDFGCVKSVDDAFYRNYFALMDDVRVNNPVDFQRMLAELDLLRPGDSPDLRERLAEVYYGSIQILSKPYQVDRFDFGDEGYMQSIYEYNENIRNDKTVEKITSSRGDANAIYINRAFFGLYTLVTRMKARVRARLPEFLVSKPALA